MKKFKRPPAWLYYPAVVCINIYMRLRYRVKIDKKALRGINGPALILANHLSDRDHLLVAMALWPHRPTFVLSEHFMTKRKLRGVLRYMNVITKRMFDSDGGTVLGIMRAARSGNVVVLFPEGRLTWYAHSMYITPGTAELVKHLKIDVYRVTPTGAALTFPKWAKKPRRGKINIESEQILSAADIKTMSADDIYGVICGKLYHDDEKSCAGISFSSPDTTLGLDGILYKCPSCRSEFTLTASGGHIRCQCGLDATLDDGYVLHGAPVSSINEWYFWQSSQLDTSEVIQSEVRVGTTDGDGYMVRDAGTGYITLSRDNFTFNGTVFGKEVSFMLPTEKIPAVPITVAQEFDIYYEKRLYYFTPTPDSRRTVKFADFFDRAAEERRAAGKTQ